MAVQSEKRLVQGRFLIERELGRGSGGIVYQVFDTEHKVRLALKTLHHLSTENIHYLKLEFRALHNVVHPNLCSLVELINDGGNAWFMTMEFVDGLDFLTLVRRGTNGSSLPFHEHRLRSSLTGLSHGLDALHTAGYVHRDIKPSNVMIDRDERVVLLDFGLIANNVLSGQTETGAFVGTPAYMAPEQLDSNSVGPAADWYSVGVMLYEAITGELPFKGTTFKMLSEKQISRPINPSDIKPGLPKDLEMLCMDLLNRDPKERPSASDVIDIIRENEPKPEYFSQAGSAAFTQNSDFVGRQAELNVLQQTYKQSIRRGNFGAVVIEGDSGVGKSALIENFTTNLLSIDPSIMVLKGRCYERESAPFKAFDGVIDSLILHLRKIPAEKAVQLKPRHSELLVRLFPALGRSEQFANDLLSSIEIEDAHELQSRSFNALKEFLTLLSDHHPLVIIVDDMQWADTDSILLLKLILSDAKPPPFLLVLLSRFGKDSQNSAFDWDTVIPTSHKRIKLETLSVNDAEELARLFISSQALSINVDAETIAREAAGHPLYIAELVQHISFGGEDWRSLRLDEVIANRVKSLPNKARQLLRTICVAGTPTESQHLQHLTQIASDDFFKSVLLLRESKLIRSRGPRKNDLIEPYHDRVREAVIAHDISVDEAINVHLSIGQFCLKTYSKVELEENIFFVVKHLYAGKELITDEMAKLRLAELLFMAGKKARASAAFASSIVYYKESIELFSSKYWETHYERMFELYCAAADSAYIIGDFLLTKKLVSVAKARAKSNLDKAKICQSYVLSMVADGRPLEAVDEAVQIMKDLGLRVPNRPSKLYVICRFVITKLRLFNKTESMLTNLPIAADEKNIASRNLLSLIGDVVYHHLPNLWATIIMKSIELSVKFGIDRNSSVFFGSWGIVICVFQKNYTLGYNYGLISMKIAEEFKDYGKQAQTLFIWANFIQHWKQHIRETLPYLLECQEKADRAGNLPYLGYAAASYCCNSFFAGTSLLKLEDDFEHYGKIIAQKKHEQSYITNQIFYQTILNFTEQSDDPTVIKGAEYNETEMYQYHLEKDQRTILYYYHLCKTVLNLFFGSCYDACMSATSSTEYVDAAVGGYRSAILPFYDSLASLKYHSEAIPRTKRQLLRRVRKNQRKYKKIACSSPANHAHKYTLVEAERARVKRQYKKAPSLYDQAIAGAIEQQFTQDAALACEFAADFYREIGDNDKTMAYAKDALGHYEKWGALAKVEHVKGKFKL